MAFDVSTIPGCGLWFATPDPAVPCCEPHQNRGIRGDEAAEMITARVAQGPTDDEINETTTALFRSVWGPLWPGWLCSYAGWEPKKAPWGVTCTSYEKVDSLILPTEFPVVAVDVKVNGVTVAADIDRTYRVRRADRSPWSLADHIEITYRHGAVPPGAYGPWLRLFCELKRLWRPQEGIESSLPAEKLGLVRSVSSPAGQVGYSDKRVEQGLAGWDPLVSAFIEAGQNQSATPMGNGGVWVPSPSRPTFVSDLMAL